MTVANNEKALMKLKTDAKGIIIGKAEYGWHYRELNGYELVDDKNNLDSYTERGVMRTDWETN